MMGTMLTESRPRNLQRSDTTAAESSAKGEGVKYVAKIDAFLKLMPKKGTSDSYLVQDTNISLE